jgi:predicted DNA-binding transcriptional regulator AlpA
VTDNLIPFPIQFLKLAEVLKITSISKPQVYRLIASGDFPPPVKVGTSSRWVESEVRVWMQARMAARGEAAAA